jgi:hypothetical protein
LTVADTIYDTINDNWGNGGYGGDTPTITTSEITKAETRTKTDVVEVRHFTLDERHKQVNDTYADKFYTVVVRVTSKTSAAQLDLLVDEVEYLIRNTAMTGVQFKSLRKSYQSTSREYGMHGCDLYVEVVAYLSSGTVTTSAGASTNIIADTLVFEDGGSTVDIIRDEDDMSSDDASALATQQSIKAYVDAVGVNDLDDTTLTGAYLEDLLMFGSANAAWVPLVFMHDADATKVKFIDGRIINVDGTDDTFEMLLPLPCVKGSLKLYIKSLKYYVYDADAGDYLDSVRISGINTGTRTDIDTDDIDRNSAGDITFSGATFPAAEIDASSYQSIIVKFTCVFTNANDFDLTNVRMQCYYDT